MGRVCGAGAGGGGGGGPTLSSDGGEGGPVRLQQVYVLLLI